MNAHSIIPLIASIAFIPLLIILGLNKAWTLQKRFFAAYLIGLASWSFGDFLFRSDYFIDYKIIIGKATLVAFFIGLASLYYFLRSYYEDRKPRVYLILICTLIAEAIIIAFIPQNVIVATSIIPVYGNWIYPIGIFGYSMIGLSIYKLSKKYMTENNPELRNQFIYLLIGISVSAIFTLSSFTKIGQEYPFAHIGNFVNALILTYAVMEYRLLDMRIILRKGLSTIVMTILGLGIYLLFYMGCNYILHIEINLTALILTALASLAVTLAVYKTRNLVSSQIERLFYRESYAYRRELDDFIKYKIKGVLNLDELGNELLSLLSGAVNCEKAFLLLPQEESHHFFTRFFIPFESDRPSFFIKSDSPILSWLRKENIYLTRENLDYLPEFKGLWREERDSINRLAIQMFFPITSRGCIIGILALGEKKKKDSYLLEEINLSERTVNSVANSLEKEYLQDQLKKREHELELINRLSSVISASLNIQEVYNAFVDELKELVEIDFTEITLIEDKEIYIAAISSQVGSAWKVEQRFPLEGTAAEWVYTNKKTLYDRDLAESRRYLTGEEYFKRGIRSLLYLPLIIKGAVTGVLIVGSIKPYAYSPEQVELLEHLAAQISAPVENSRLYKKAEQMARIDGMTGLFNRRHLDERLREEINRHARYGEILTLLMVDLDYFKKYNDTYGHQAGDRILIQAASIITNTIRSTDIAFRYGGDEFAVILPNSSTSDAFSVAERIREKIGFEMALKKLNITASIGMASWPGDGSNLDELCSAADIALYYAKRTGLNRTSIASKTLFSLAETSLRPNAVDEQGLSTIYALAATLEARDKYTYGHSRRVSRYSVTVAEALQLPPEQVSIISTAALLHDIGKIGIPDHVLNKPSSLTDNEWSLLKSHPVLSATILGHVPSLNACLAAVKYHHERWDGQGYPSGLKGEDIPIEARILCVTDAFEAMISDRSYRSARTYKQAIAELERCAGSQFDASIVKIFIPIALATVPDEVEI